MLVLDEPVSASPVLEVSTPVSVPVSAPVSVSAAPVLGPPVLVPDTPTVVSSPLLPGPPVVGVGSVLAPELSSAPCVALPPVSFVSVAVTVAVAVAVTPVDALLCVVVPVAPLLLASPLLPSTGLRPHAANITTPTTHRAIIRPIYALMAQVAGKARCARMPAAGRPGAHAVTRSRGHAA
jgi:hypothetical protein